MFLVDLRLETRREGGFYFFPSFFSFFFFWTSRKRERETSICCSTYLCIRWLTPVCAPMGVGVRGVEGTHPQPWRSRMLLQPTKLLPGQRVLLFNLHSAACFKFSTMNRKCP